jgi:hypothetical protein
MAKTTVAIDLQATTSGAQSVKSLKQEIKEAQAEAVQLARKFGDFSPEATKAAQRVAKLKDEMGDFQQRVAALNPDKFQAIAGITQGIAGGISAMTGAMALFGSESEDVQKLMAKVQGAIAFSQGVQQIMDLRNSFGAVATMIKTNVVAAFTTLKGAMIATGIGAVIAGVAALINYMDDLADATQRAADEQERLNKYYDQVWAKDDMDTKIRIANAKARGASSEELYKIERRNIERRIEDLTYEIAQGKDFNAQRDMLYKQLQLLDAEHNASMAEQRTAAEKERQAAHKELIEQRKKEAQELIDLEAEIQAQVGKTNKERREEVQDEIAAGDAEWLMNTQEYQAETMAKFREQDEQKQREYAAKIAAQRQAWDREQLKNEQAAQQQRVALTADGFQAISQLVAGFAGQSEAQQRRAFEIQKLSNIAQTIVETFSAAQGAYRSQVAIPTPDAPVRAAVAAGIAVAQGLARVAAIKNTKFGQTGVGGATGGGVASSPTFTPTTFGSLPDEAGQFAGMGRVFVLEGDITKTQSRVRRLRNTSVV